jgi:gas vesicle protein
MTLNYRQRVTLVGGLVGAFIGVMVAMAYLKQLGRERPMEKMNVSLGDAIKLGASTLALLRQIADMTG